MRIRKTRGEAVFDAANVVFMALVLFITLYPFWYVLVYSFNEGVDASRGGIYFWPRQFSLLNYQAIFKNSDLVNGFIVTLARTLAGTVSAVLLTGLVAYGLSHQNLYGRRFYMVFGTITMFFSAGLIPYYLLIRDLGLRNSFWVYVIPSMFSFYNMIIMMTFFRQLPEGLEEAAKIEGAGYWHIFFRIVLPLSGPILATMALFNGVYHWNDYFTAILYIDNKALLPIQTILFRIVAESQGATMLANVNLPDIVARRRITSESVKMATMMVTTIPIICVYPFLQKYFVKGMLIGSIKG